MRYEINLQKVKEFEDVPPEEITCVFPFHADPRFPERRPSAEKKIRKCKKVGCPYMQRIETDSDSEGD